MANQLLAGCGASGDLSWEVLKGGRNNRVYKVHSPQKDFIVKHYFRHRNDSRDRCFTEFSFSTFLWKNGITCIPEPVAFNRDAGFAVYGAIYGAKLSHEDISKSVMQQSVSFFQSINAYRKEPRAHQLGIASEACFSIDAHVSCVEERVRSLVNHCKSGGLEYEPKQFVLRDLNPVWDGIKDDIVGKLSADFKRVIPDFNKRLSPSDFGFHNILMLPDGRLAFLDFEYAGWDDVAKTICDFFLQPHVRVPAIYLELFVDGILHDFIDKAEQKIRYELLRPIYQIKWCCILLNEFLPVSEERRRFAGNEEDRSRQKQEQLNLARAYLEEARSGLDARLGCQSLL